MTKKEFNFDVSAYPSLPAMKGLFITATDTEVAGLFRRLTGEAKRTRLTVASRHDLETLGAG